MAMQTIYDLDEKEVATLTEAAIQSFIDVECAQKGVMLLPAQPAEPAKPQIVLDMTMYDYLGLHFQSSEAAAAVMEEVGRHKQFSYDYKANTRIYKPGNHYSSDRMSAEKGMSQETYLKHKEALDTYDRDKSLYDAAKKAYDKAVTARSGIVSSITDHVTTCREIVQEEQLIRDTMAKYIDLAKGDEAIAYGFLTAAKPNMELDHPHNELWDELDRKHNAPQLVEEAA